MEDTKILDISLEDQTILIGTVGNLTNVHRQSNNATSRTSTTFTTDIAENLQTCGSICVYNPQQKLIFICEFCDLKYSDLDGLGCHLREAHNLFRTDVKSEVDVVNNFCNSPEISNAVKQEPPIDLPPSYFNEPLVSCGNIFICNQRNFILACGYCNCSKYFNLDIFEKHIKQQHNILDGLYNELSLVPKVEKIKEEVFIITEIGEAPSIKEEVVEFEKETEEDTDIKEELICEADDEMEEGEEFDDESDYDEDDEPEDMSVYNCSKRIQIKCKQSASSENGTKNSNTHQSNEQSTLDLQCKICLKRFKRSPNLKDHMIRHLGEAAKKYNCEHCEMKFFHKSELNRHQLIHIAETYKCDICYKKFLTTEQLSDHKKRCEDRRFKCEHCDKTFKHNGELKIHTRVHTDEKPYECDTCHKRFRAQANLINHKKIHFESSFKCDICYRKFLTVDNLNDHKKRHEGEGERIFNCEHCDKIFKRSDLLNDHIRIHTGEKPYECDICHKRLTSQRYLFTHKKSHMEKTLKCNHCDKLFNRNFELTRHMKTHTKIICKPESIKPAAAGKLRDKRKTVEGPDERNFNCDQCDKKFKLLCYLKDHLRIHTGEKPYECEVCHKYFRTLSNLIHHKKTHVTKS